MGVGDALDLYDRVKEAKEQAEYQAWYEQEGWIYDAIGGFLYVIIIGLVIYFVAHKIIKIRRENKQYKTEKVMSKQIIQQSNPVPATPQQSMGMSQRIVDPNQYGLVAVGILKVKSIVQAASYREIVCSFHNNDINLDFNLTDVGEYKWLNEGDEIKVHLAKDQFKYYISKCDM